MTNSWKDLVIPGFAVLGGVMVLDKLSGLLVQKVHEDDIDFIPQREGTWAIVDKESGNELGVLVVLEYGLRAYLDYAPDKEAVHYKLDWEAGVEKDLDAARDLVVDYLRTNNLLG